MLESSTQGVVPHRVLFLDADRGDAAQPLQGDPPAPSAGAGVVDQRRASPPSARCSSRSRPAPTWSSTPPGISAADLRRRIADELLPRQATQKLAVTFESFGFKHGPPRDADLSFDVRFLPNPHYDPRPAPLTGRDQRVVDYVARDGELATFYERCSSRCWTSCCRPYLAEGKAHLMVAIGCTGGRHRSVAIAEHLGSRYRDRDDLFVEVVHRDADRFAQP